MMGKHGPEATQCLSGDPRAKLRYVALEIGAYEVFPPAQALGVVHGEKTLREAATQPEPVDRRLHLLRADLEHREGAQFEVADPSGQSLAGLLEKVQRGRTQQEVHPVAVARPPGAIDETAQHREEAGDAVHLI